MFSYYGRITILVTLTPGQQAARPKALVKEECHTALRWKKEEAARPSTLCPSPVSLGQGAPGPGWDPASQAHSRVVQRSAAGARHTHPANHRPCRLPIPSAPQRVEGVDALWQCPLQTTLFVALEPPHQAPLSIPRARLSSGTTATITGE